MDMLTDRQGYSLPLAAVIAGSIGIGAGIVIGTLPAALLESLVTAFGLPTMLSAAQPPLGLTARLLAAIAAAGAFGAISLWPLSRMHGRRRLRIRSPRRETALRQAPPAPEAAAPVRPIAAHDELGAPLLSAPARAAVPVEPSRVTEMVEMVGGIYIPDRRRRPRVQRPRDPVFDEPPTVSNLLKRLEAAIASEQLGPLGRRPLDPGFREAVERLGDLRKAG